jgi:transcriptional regulator with XRE-family HTH domain
MEKFSLERFGERLREVRTLRGFGAEGQLRAFCREYKQNPSVWSELERGKKTLYLESLVTLCEQFNVAPNWLLFGLEPKSLNPEQNLKSNAAISRQLLRAARNSTTRGNESQGTKQTPKAGAIPISTRRNFDKNPRG